MTKSLVVKRTDVEIEAEEAAQELKPTGYSLEIVHWERASKVEDLGGSRTVLAILSLLNEIMREVARLNKRIDDSEREARRKR